jgi:hypothetical protein|tara:strand:- start:45 stop:206 length:162 start_codon:yes stop_codon:yes gene_type:complete
MGSNLNKKAYAVKLAERIKSTIKYSEDAEKNREKVSKENGKPAYKSERGWWKK